jgi:hypothetical protein
MDRLCGLVVRVPGYRTICLGSIPSPTRCSDQKWVWIGVHSASWVQSRSYFKERVAAPVYKTDNMDMGIPYSDHARPLYPQKLVLTSPTSGGRSVGIVRSRTKARELLRNSDQIAQEY